MIINCLCNYRRTVIFVGYFIKETGRFAALFLRVQQKHSEKFARNRSCNGNTHGLCFYLSKFQLVIITIGIRKMFIFPPVVDIGYIMLTLMTNPRCKVHA